MPKNIKNNMFCFITISMKIWKISYSRVNTKFLLMSSLEIKIALLLHASSFNCLFLRFGLVWYYIYMYPHILIFLYSDQFILRFSHLSFGGEHSLFAVQNPLFSLSSTDSTKGKWNWIEKDEDNPRVILFLYQEHMFFWLHRFIL